MAWVPGSRSKFGNWTSVPSLYSWNIAECDVKPQSTTTTQYKSIYTSIIMLFKQRLGYKMHEYEQSTYQNNCHKESCWKCHQPKLFFFYNIFWKQYQCSFSSLQKGIFIHFCLCCHTCCSLLSIVRCEIPVDTSESDLNIIFQIVGVLRTY